MKKSILTVLLVVFFLSVRAQDDTVASLRPSLWTPLSGTALLATGTAFTFVPSLKNMAVEIRDAVQADGHEKITFDNYVQYLPAATPPLLNLCGLKSKNTFKKMALLEGGSFLLGALVLNAAKYGFAVQRPDLTKYNSFPSGHTFTAFTGAEVLRREYGEEYPWLAVAGYTVATLVGAMRIYNNRHWLGDVLAGAGLGILSVEVTYWIAN